MKTSLMLIIVSSLLESSAQSLYEDYNNHHCIRPCTENGEPKVCKYDFTIEYYHTLTQACYNCPFNITDCARRHCVSADGVSRAIMTVNRILPGPAIHVCQGDTVVVNVKNMLEGGEGVSLHWHGILQEGTPHMDGVPMLTQCPIHQHTTFQYRFKAQDPGTHFWHAHSGFQRTDGVFGAFVIRQTIYLDKHSILYDEDLPEHTIVLNDWLEKMGAASFVAGHHAMKEHLPSSILINGRGTVKQFSDMPDHAEHAQENMAATDSSATTHSMDTTTPDSMANHMMHRRSAEDTNMASHNMDGSSTSQSMHGRHTPPSVFEVSKGKKYRFRLINNGIGNCPIQFSIDHHSLTMITTDGSPFNPVVVESFTMFAGERYDFILQANKPVRNYWIRAIGLAECGPQYKSVSQTALLKYEGAAAVLPPESSDYQTGNRAGTMLNPLNVGPSRTLITVDQLDSFMPDDEVLKPIPDKKFFIAMDFNTVENPRFHDNRYYPLKTMMNKHGQGIHVQHMLSPQLNHISFKMPSSPPLSLSSHNTEKNFCDETTVGKNCSKEFCECTHRLKVKLGEVVELVLVDEGNTTESNHPMHLHGHTFRVVAMEKLDTSTSVEYVKSLDSMGQIKRKLHRAVIKDTVTVPDGGYTIIRFKATNAGFWLFHCHIAFHMEMGMSLIIQVGEEEDMPKPPKSFPRCGDWTPDTSDEQDFQELKSCPPQTSSAVSITFFVTTQILVVVVALLNIYM